MTPASTSNTQSAETGRATTEVAPKKNRPRATRLRQQQLPAWQPILTSTTVIPTIFVIGLVFIPIGILLYMASLSVEEIVLPYDNCTQENCELTFYVEKDMKAPVYFYYGLENYFQNHRRYMKSRNDRQLLGDLEAIDGCLHYDYGYNEQGKRLKIAPCGAIAASKFNDTFHLFREMEKGSVKVPWTYKGIVWDVDRTLKFRNPPVGPNETLCDVIDRVSVQPVNWGKKKLCELDLQNPDNNGLQNADLIVWMRTAALPDFRKPYRILDGSQTEMFRTGLPVGKYRLEIENNYPVSAVSGKKSFIASTTSWAGGKNDFLGIAYITVGVICIILSAVFLVIHRKFGYYLSEMTLPLR